MNQDVFERLKAYQDDPAVLREVANALDAAERRATVKAYREQYVAKLISQGSVHPHFKCLALVKDRSKRYAPHEFAPDPFEDLERNGLVICDYEGGNGLRARTLSITSAGRDVLEKIEIITS